MEETKSEPNKSTEGAATEPPSSQEADSNAAPAQETTSEVSDETASIVAPAGAISELQEDRIKQLEQALEELALQQQEETHTYVEQIDALQAKLQYLAREATDAARKAAKEAPPGSLDKKLAEKDQQIAGLMEEGKNLASTEQKLRTIIKNLRAKIGENEKEINVVKTSRGKVEQELESTGRRAKRADDLEKCQEELHKRIGQSQKEIDGLKSEVSNKDRTIADLKAQLQKSAEEAEALTAKVNEEALAKERQRVRALEEELSDLKVEKELVADRGRARENELREKAERAAERARAVEVELKSEIQTMESKLESMRVMAEEVSSGAMGDSQAKLLRQVETLQTQYAIATENWQGIESTLLGRVASLEKERDEAQQRESDMRKKAREAVSVLGPVCTIRIWLLTHARLGSPSETSRRGIRRYENTDTHDTGRRQDISVGNSRSQETRRSGRSGSRRGQGGSGEAKDCMRGGRSEQSRAVRPTRAVDRSGTGSIHQVRKQA